MARTKAQIEKELAAFKCRVDNAIDDVDAQNEDNKEKFRAILAGKDAKLDGEYEATIKFTINGQSDPELISTLISEFGFENVEDLITTFGEDLSDFGPRNSIESYLRQFTNNGSLEIWTDSIRKVK